MSDKLDDRRTVWRSSCNQVVRTALENGVSVASVLLLTDATLTEIPEKTELNSPSLGSELPV